MRMERSKYAGLKGGLIAVAFVGVTAYGYTALGEADMTSFLMWWLTLLVLGIGFMPMTMVLFHQFKDKGWIFSKAIGLAVTGWLVWYLASCRLFKFTVANCYIVTAVCFGLNILLLYYYGKKRKKGDLRGNPYLGINGDNLVAAAATELVFFVAFLFWTYLRAFKPEIMGNTEKFMDYGLMVSIDNAVYMPAEDMWLAGETINYYYLGQYLCTFVKRLSGVAIEKSYNLSLMMVAGFACAMPYSLMNQVASDFARCKPARVKGKLEITEERAGAWFGPVIGLVAGLAVCFAGNMHYTVVNGIALKNEKVKEWLSIDRDFYWFPDATRYIGYAPDRPDKTIHEFPSYSFILGDLHAHVINIMFVLTVMAVLYTILQLRSRRMREYRFNPQGAIAYPETKSEMIREAFLPQVVLIGFFIGFFHMTNYWDYPIYFVVAGAVILFSNAVICHFRQKALWLTAAHAAVVLGISFIVSLPFKLTFDQISTGVSISLKHSPLHQLVILWGLPITTVITFLVIMIRRMNRSAGTKENGKKKAVQAESTGEETFAERHPALDWLYRMITSLEVSDLFILTLGLCACGLILLPELVYVRDIYSGDYKRANTMFKLTYQAYIMFGMCMAYISFRLLRFREKLSHGVFSVVVLALLASTLGYFGIAAESWFGDYKDNSRYQGLDCVAFMDEYFPEDYAAVQWINENITEPSVIVEGVGYSYTYYQRISATTGHATIMGWETHEWLWRSEAEFGKPEMIPERQADVGILYTTTDKSTAMNVIDKYDVDYIYVGKAERYNGLMTGNAAEDGTVPEGYGYNRADGKYYLEQDVNDELIRSLGEVVYQASGEDGNIYDENGEYRTYIVKISK